MTMEELLKFPERRYNHFKPRIQRPQHCDRGIVTIANTAVGQYKFLMAVKYVWVKFMRCCFSASCSFFSFLFFSFLGLNDVSSEYSGSCERNEILELTSIYIQLKVQNNGDSSWTSNNTFQ